MAGDRVRTAMNVTALEHELVIRGFFDVLNYGRANELHAFLSEEVLYTPSTGGCVFGRSAVVALVPDIRNGFEEWNTAVAEVTMSGNIAHTVLITCLKRPAGKPRQIVSDATFHLEGFRIRSCTVCDRRRAGSTYVEHFGDERRQTTIAPQSTLGHVDAILTPPRPRRSDRAT
jgi:hypothetical protein